MLLWFQEIFTYSVLWQTKYRGNSMDHKGRFHFVKYYTFLPFVIYDKCRNTNKKMLTFLFLIHLMAFSTEAQVTG